MKDLTLPTPALPPTIQGGAITDPEDKAFFAFWYGHMLNDLMQPPLSNVDHATARYIWNHARAALSSHHEDGGRAATDKDSLTVAPVVALGGEPPCNPHPDAPHGYNRNASHNAGRYVCDCEGWAALGGEKGEAVDMRAAFWAWVDEQGCDTDGAWSAWQGAWNLRAAPVGKARMLTDEEADHITGMHNTGRAQGDSECAEAIQRKFCEVNGITLEGGNRSRG